MAAVGQERTLTIDGYEASRLRTDWFEGCSSVQHLGRHRAVGYGNAPVAISVLIDRLIPRACAPVLFKVGHLLPVWRDAQASRDSQAQALLGVDLR